VLLSETVEHCQTFAYEHNLKDRLFRARALDLLARVEALAPFDRLERRPPASPLQGGHKGGGIMSDGPRIDKPLEPEQLAAQDAMLNVLGLQANLNTVAYTKTVAWARQFRSSTQANSSHGIYRLDGDRVTWPGNDLGCPVTGDLEKAIVREMSQTDKRPLADVLKAPELSMLEDNGYYQAQLRLNRKLSDHGAPFHFHVRERVIEVVRTPYSPRQSPPSDGRRKQ
jgi:hypothetical protein